MTLIESLDREQRAESQQRLFSKIDTSAGLWGCWEWQGYTGTNGYGQVYFRSHLASVHRAIYELYHGPIPDDLLVCHTCDNRRCANPAHLFLGTPADNVADMCAKGRHAHISLTGERNGFAKLTEANVREILAMLRAGASQRAIAKRFGVAQAHISRINRGVSWAWLPDELEADPEGQVAA